MAMSNGALEKAKNAVVGVVQRAGDVVNASGSAVTDIVVSTRGAGEITGKSTVASDGQELVGRAWPYPHIRQRHVGRVSSCRRQRPGDMVEILGRGGQTVDDLQTMATVMASAPSTPSPTASA
jgi:hypothetical protein